VPDGPTVSATDVEQALPLYESKLDTSFFRVRLDRTTEAQRISDVAGKLGRTSPQVAPTRAELINMGLLYTPQHGYAAFTVPHFDKFMKRAMPELVRPVARRRTSK
jgi:hypothetical protein